MWGGGCTPEGFTHSFSDSCLLELILVPTPSYCLSLDQIPYIPPCCFGKGQVTPLPHTDWSLSAFFLTIPDLTWSEVIAQGLGARAGYILKVVPFCLMPQTYLSWVPCIHERPNPQTCLVPRAQHSEEMNRLDMLSRLGTKVSWFEQRGVSGSGLQNTEKSPHFFHLA